MDISRMKKLFAGMSAVAISLTQMGTVFAAYSDVPAGVWYEDAVEAFTDLDYLDASQTRFRGGDNANRAEFIKLIVMMNGGLLSTPPAVASFNDVQPGAWYYSFMEEAAKEGWVKGDNNCYGSKPCYARPGANINRAEAAAVIVRAFGLEPTGDAPEFVDVPSGQWYTDPVQTAADYCVLQGDGGTGRARPADFMNRAEMVVMLHRVEMDMTYGVDCSREPITDPAITDVTAISPTVVEVEFNMELDEDAAADASLYMVSGADDIDVESVEIIDESTVELTLADPTTANDDYTLSVEDMVTADGETFSDSMDFGGYTDIEQGEGTLEVSLASTNPASDRVPGGAIGVVMTSVDLTASCEDDVIVSEITVLHEGFGASSDIQGVYAAVDGARLTRKRSVDNQDQTSVLRFQEPLVVESCDTVTVDIVADFELNAIAGSEHNFAIELPSDLQSNALDVDGTFPVRGNTFEIAAVDVGTIDFSYRSVSPSTTEVGATGVVLSKFELDASSNEDQTVYSITLEQNGSASDGDVTNLKIRRSDRTVLTNTVASTRGDFVTFVFDPPFTILEGASVTLEVIGDVTGGVGGTGDEILFELEEESDLFAVGSLYGYGNNGQLYGSQVDITNPGDASGIDIEAGELTIEIDGPTRQSYTADDDDAVLANVNTSTGDESIEVQELYFAVRARTSTGGAITASTISTIVSDVELFNRASGRTISATAVGTPLTNGGLSYQIYRLDDFVLEGNQEWQIRADFGSSTVDGTEFRIDLCASAADASCGGLFGTDYEIEAEGESTGDAVTDIRPNTIITGQFHTIAAAELVISVEGIGSTETAVRNTKNINLLRFSARAGEGEDILFRGAIFVADDGTLLNAQNYTLWVDDDGDSVVDTILESGVAAQNSEVAFSELAAGGYPIEAEETVYFEVHADVASAIQGDNQLELAFTTAADIEAEEVDNNSNVDDITLNETTDSKLYTFVQAGDLFVTKDTESVRSRQLLGGTLADSVLRLNFRAQNEDIDVDQIQVVATGSLVGAQSIERLELYKAGETTAFATALPSSSATCGGNPTVGFTGSPTSLTFCATIPNNQLIIRRGQPDVDVIVRPRMKTDENGARSSSGVTFYTGSGAIEARGVASSSELATNDNDTSADGELFIGTNSAASNAQISGNVNNVVLSKIVNIVDANPDSNSTSAVPTGNPTIAQFRFTAATNTNSRNGINTAVLSGVIFNVSATNVNLEGSSFEWYNTADTSTEVACTLVGAVTSSGSLQVRCLDTAALNTAIASGNSATFGLKVVIDNPQVSASANSTLQVSLQNFTDATENAFGPTDSHIQWNDTDTQTTRFYWIEFGEQTVNSTSYRS
jgi:hypothetical protein